MKNANLDALNFNNSSEFKSNLKAENYKTYTYPSNINIQNDGLPKQDFTFNEVPFLAFQEHKKQYNKIVTDAYKTYGSNSALSEAFFSEANIKKVQKGLTYYVIRRTGNKVIIEDQPIEDIIIRMRGTYYTHGRFLENNIDKQVKELNMITIKELIPECITEIKQRLGYLRDISRPPAPMDQPMNVSSSGKRTLSSTSNIIFAAQYPNITPIVG